jgi:DNA replication and repair protein RecF
LLQKVVKQCNNGAMILTHLSLQNFRNYKKEQFSFDKNTTIVIGPNTSGKTNLLEAISLLSTGKSNHAEKETQAVRFGEEMAKVKGSVLGETLEIVLTNGIVAGIETPQKRYLVNDVSKRRVDFASHLVTVSFSPSTVDIISGSPSLRRNLLDEVLEAVDRQYRISLTTYTKALRQRNALLHLAKETGVRNDKQFEYWDTLLITHGTYITQKREEFLTFINTVSHEVLPLTTTYDHSKISKERLLQYKEAEKGAGVTLVGPHRDDFFVEMEFGSEKRNVKEYGSRGQQRLVVFQLKLLQLLYIEMQTGQRPLLLLDDIFSELDDGHIGLVQSLLGKQQTIMTTTHKEFVAQNMLTDATVLELKLDETSS